MPTKVQLMHGRWFLFDETGAKVGRFDSEADARAAASKRDGGAASDDAENLGRKNKADLIAIAEARGLLVDDSMTKGQLVALIEADAASR